MSWLKQNWVWLALIALGGLGLWLFGKKNDPAAKAREAKEKYRQENLAANEAKDPAENA